MFWCKCLFKCLFSEFICRRHQANIYQGYFFFLSYLKHTILSNGCRQGQNAPKILGGCCFVFLLLSWKSCMGKKFCSIALFRQNNSLQWPLMPKEVTNTSSWRPSFQHSTKRPVLTSSKWIWPCVNIRHFRHHTGRNKTSLLQVYVFSELQQESIKMGFWYIT